MHGKHGNHIDKRMSQSECSTIAGARISTMIYVKAPVICYRGINIRRSTRL